MCESNREACKAQGRNGAKPPGVAQCWRTAIDAAAAAVIQPRSLGALTWREAAPWCHDKGFLRPTVPARFRVAVAGTCNKRARGPAGGEPPAAARWAAQQGLSRPVPALWVVPGWCGQQPRRDIGPLLGPRLGRTRMRGARAGLECVDPFGQVLDQPGGLVGDEAV